MYSDTNLKLLPGKNTQKVNKQDSENWVFDELNKINIDIINRQKFEPWSMLTHCFLLG